MAYCLGASFFADFMPFLVTFRPGSQKNLVENSATFLCKLNKIIKKYYFLFRKLRFLKMIGKFNLLMPLKTLIFRKIRQFYENFIYSNKSCFWLDQKIKVNIYLQYNLDGFL